LEHITIARIWLCQLFCHSVSYSVNHLITATYLFPLGKMLLLMAWKDPQEKLNSDSKLREFFLPNLCIADKSVHLGFWSIWHHLIILFLAKIIKILLSWNNLNMGNIFVDLTEQLAQSNSEYSLLFCLPWINNSEI